MTRTRAWRLGEAAPLGAEEREGRPAADHHVGADAAGADVAVGDARAPTGRPPRRRPRRRHAQPGDEAPRLAARSGSASAASDSANAISPHISPQPATGTPVQLWTATASGLSHTLAQSTAPSAAQNAAPPHADDHQLAPQEQRPQRGAAARATRAMSGRLARGGCVVTSPGLPNPATGSQPDTDSRPSLPSL